MPEVIVDSIEGTVSIVPMLSFVSMDRIKEIHVPYETAEVVLMQVESNGFPDEILIVSAGGYQFEFAPGEPANKALAVLSWFRDAVRAAGLPPGVDLGN
jgi:hypothetical protein